MKRMKKYSYILLALPLLLGSCEAYLDVNPKSEVTDKELFSTAEGCEDAIYGIYTEMGTNKNLFAYALTFAYPELMTGNFTISQSDNLAYVVQRLWEHENAITVAENLWINGYKAIGYVNKALMHVLPKSDDEFRHIRLYKGELLALRAYLHFEMARIFAVPFASGDAAAKAKAIPYVTTYGIEVTPYSSLDKVFELIVADLTEAEKYLAADEELVTATRDNASDGFTSCRITHLNLYAVQALLARAYWTMGKLDLAEDYAEKVIDSGKFPLMTTAEAWNAVETGTLNMQETVFGLYSTQYTYNFYRNHIYQGGTLALSSQYSEIYSTDLSGTDQALLDLVRHGQFVVHQALQQDVRPGREQPHIQRQINPRTESDPDSRNVLHRGRSQPHERPGQGDGIPRLRGEVARPDAFRRARNGQNHRKQHHQRTPEGVFRRRRGFLQHETIAAGHRDTGRQFRGNRRRDLHDAHPAERRGQLQTITQDL